MTPPSNSLTRRPVVSVVFRYVHHYRREFYELLRERLDAAGVDLHLLAGNPGPSDAPKQDAITLPWAEPLDNVYLTVRERELCWQPALRRVRSSDLVVVEQASRLVLNYLLLASRPLGGPKVAFWGQGEHVLRHRASGVGESLKAFITRRADWFFAYNERSVDVVRGLGFPLERITCVRNAVDTRAVAEVREAQTEAVRQDVRRELQVGPGPLGIYVGSLYPEKRIAFLVAAADRIRELVPGFQLVVAGAGPDERIVREAVTRRRWLRAPGPLYGARKAAALAASDVFLIPGAVGLGILDAFAAGVPPVTTAVPYHGHEVAYVADGRNGLVLPDWRNPESYARAVAALLGDAARLRLLREGCVAAAVDLTVEAMADNFAGGVLAALAVDGARGGPAR